ncbi:MAG: Mth938-like domain-containing protein [Burkholderiales bacterium]|nr:Mth938-like domain-containing protein [Burkholderiales bacterium]
MKLQPDRSDAPTLSGHGPGWVAVDGEKITHSVIVTSRGERIEWAATFEELGAEHFATLAALQLEVVIFGSGSRIRFPKPQWVQPLAEQRVGVETMDTAAACRTYNILAQEGRVVAAALIVERAT